MKPLLEKSPLLLLSVAPARPRGAVGTGLVCVASGAGVSGAFGLAGGGGQAAGPWFLDRLPDGGLLPRGLSSGSSQLLRAQCRPGPGLASPFSVADLRPGMNS